MVLRKFLVLPYVNKMEGLTTIQPGFDIRTQTFLDRALCRSTSLRKPGLCFMTSPEIATPAQHLSFLRKPPFVKLTRACTFIDSP